MALKEKCEKTNWFEYAQGLGKEGRYLAEDPLVKDCRGVEIISETQIDQGFKLGREKACTYDEIFQRGKLGQVFFFKFCDALEPVRMKARHQEGLNLFCVKESGYPYGKSGQLYQNVCSKEQEVQFLPTYYAGRKDHLSEKIKNIELRLGQLNNEISQQLQRESMMSREYANIPNLSDCSHTLVFDESTKKEVSRLICKESFSITSQRDRLSTSLSTLRAQLAKLYAEKKSNEEELISSKAQLSQIP